MQAISEIVHSALNEITNGQIYLIPRVAMTPLLDDFLYAWLIRLGIPYDFKRLNAARRLFTGSNKMIFIVTDTRSVEEIRDKFSEYINKWHSSDHRVILSLSFDGKKIDAEWIERQKYVESSR